MRLVFFSHSSKDKPLARRVATDLQTADIDIYLDEWREILVGGSFSNAFRALGNRDFVATLPSQYSMESGWFEK